MARGVTFLSRMAGIDLLLERLDMLDRGQAAIIGQMKTANGRTKKLEERETARYERERLADVAGTEKRSGRRDIKAAVAGALVAGVIAEFHAILHVFGLG